MTKREEEVVKGCKIVYLNGKQETIKRMEQWFAKKIGKPVKRTS